MKRNVSMTDISDGQLYTSQDMVRADCRGCQGCSECCQGMGNSLILDPLDVWQLCRHLGQTFETLIRGAVSLNVVDGLILPNIRMEGTSERCYYLDHDGRCSIHAFRPGICRLFPLGRLYEDGTFKYFLQTQECPMPGKQKVRVRQWLGIEDLKTYEMFVTDWHYFLNKAEALVENAPTQEVIRQINMLVLNVFYIQPYREGEDFYAQFYERLRQTEHELMTKQNQRGTNDE